MGILGWLRRAAMGDAQSSPSTSPEVLPAPLPPAPPVPAALPAPGAPLLALGPMAPAMRRAALLRGVVNPTLAWLSGIGIHGDDRARVMLLAIAGQEADCQHRRQIPVAHAMGLWQFERGGGVAGVISHRASAKPAATVLEARGVRAISGEVHKALERDDVLACAFARLLLWTEAPPLPAVGDELEAWRYYVRAWRPGAYLRPPYSIHNLPPPSARWAGNYRMAVEAVRS
jgi:hypothetical protein